MADFCPAKIGAQRTGREAHNLANLAHPARREFTELSHNLRGKSHMVSRTPEGASASSKPAMLTAKPEEQPKRKHKKCLNSA
jgi:hypothetical protein